MSGHAKILQVELGGLVVRVGGTYRTSNRTFPIVKIVEIIARLDAAFDALVDTTHPSLGHKLTANLGVEEMLEEIKK